MFSTARRRPCQSALVCTLTVVALWMLPRCALAAITPTISSISNPIFVGDSFTVIGSGFTAGSVANFFVATRAAPINFGPLPQSGHTGTTLTIPVPASTVTTLGQGVVSVVVVNTDQGFTKSNSVTAQLFGDNHDGFPNLTTINGFPLAATSTEPGFATDNVETVVVQNHTVTMGGNGFDTVNGVAIDLFCDCLGGKMPTVFLKSGRRRSERYIAHFHAVRQRGYRSGVVRGLQRGSETRLRDQEQRGIGFDRRGGHSQ